MTVVVEDVAGTATSGLPYRQLSRLTTELYASYNELAATLLPGRFTEATAWVLVARACLDDWIGPAGIAAPDAPTRWITVNAIAASLNRSAETTRRHVRWMADRDLLVRTPAGVALSPSPANARWVRSYYLALHDLLIRLVEDIAATCDLRFAVGGGDGARSDGSRVAAAEVIARALDVALMPFNADRTLLADWEAMMLWTLVGAANIRHVTYDPILSRRYAIASSPDALRRPVPLHPIARALRLPYATAWRKVRRLKEAGLIARRDEGWVVLTHQLRANQVESMVIRSTDYIVRRVRELARLGLDTDSPAHAYCYGRPPLAKVD